MAGRSSTSAGENVEHKIDICSSEPPASLPFDPLAKRQRKAFLRRDYVRLAESAAEQVTFQPRTPAQFESRRLLETLQLPDKTKKCICVLKNPDTGSLVYLIGTNSYSKASAADVRMLIEAVRPEVVALEVGNSE